MNTNCNDNHNQEKSTCGCKRENQTNDAYNDKYMNGHETEAPKDSATDKLHDDTGFRKDYNNYERKG